MKRLSKGILIGAAVVAIAGMAQAQFEKAEDAIKYRKSAMVLIAAHLKDLGAMVQGKTPYAPEAFSHNAATLMFLSKLPWTAMMVPGTDQGDTTLSKAVFSERDKFQAAAAAFQAGTAKLSDMAAAGDFEAAKAQFGAVAGGCKSCHTTFRTK